MSLPALRQIVVTNCSLLNLTDMTTSPMTENVAALYNACETIIGIYCGTDLIDGVTVGDTTAYQFYKFAKQVFNEISEGVI